jgi:aconitate hydratase
MSIYDAAMRYAQDGVPLIVFGGKEYGTGSSRDWAAKGSLLLGIKAVVVESFERIHRSNLIGMGVLPLQFKPGDTRDSLNLTADATYDIGGLQVGAKTVKLVVNESAGRREIDVDVRIDTPKEWDYYVNGGILHYVLRQLATNSDRAA